MDTTHLSLLERLGSAQSQEDWDTFHRIYSHILRSYLGGIARTRRLQDADIDEVVQNVFVNLVRTLGSHKHDPARGRFRTWLYTLTMNALADHCEKNKRHESNQPLPPEVPGTGGGPGWEDNYEQGLLSEVLAKMKAEHRDDPVPWRAFEEQYLKGRKAKEVAAELGISVALVYQHASRMGKEIVARSRAIDGGGNA
ncbi:MAG: RNA polymerase sigma factor [Pirellulaceae bacterium]